VYVLKPTERTMVATLLAKGVSQREIARLTGVDRTTIRGIARKLAGPEPNSPPPRPPGFRPTLPSGNCQICFNSL